VLLRMFEWCEATALGAVVRESLWMFPVIEAVHLLALGVLGGSLLLVDLRLLGLGLTGQTPADLLGYARPWLIFAVGVLVLTGGLLFLSEALKLYYSRSFWVKMITLPLALTFTFVVRNRWVRTGVDSPWRSRLTGALSLALWFTVAAAGRWIGYS